MSIASSISNLLSAEQNLDAAIRGIASCDHRRAVTKMHAALDQTRAAFILLNEGESAKVGHSDDPK